MLGGARAASPTLRSQMEEAGLTASSSSGRLSPHRRSRRLAAAERGAKPAAAGPRQAREQRAARGQYKLIGIAPMGSGHIETCTCEW